MRKVIVGLLCFCLMVNVSLGYTLTVNDFSRTGVNSGREITINAVEKNGKKFKGWEVISGNLVLTDPSYRSITFTMPAEDVELRANYDTGDSNNKYNLTIESLFFTRSEKKSEGESVTIEAITNSDTKTFSGWTATGITLTEEQKKSSTITFTMPAGDVKLIANYADSTDKYLVTIETPYHTRIEEWKKGETVTVEALADGSALTFKSWTATGITLTTAQKENGTLTFTMPGNAVNLTAIYE